MKEMDPLSTELLLHHAIILLKGLDGFQADDGFTLRHLQGGANNRTYALESEQAQALLKVYFQHPGDNRNRLENEFAFMQYAWNKGLRCIAQPYARDDKLSIGLYEFITGDSIKSGDVTWKHVAQATAFFNTLNEEQIEAPILPVASEACFCIDEHLRCVEQRIERLSEIEANEVDARIFVQEELQPAWRQAYDAAVRNAKGWKLSLHEELASNDRCISPSDFGFHNALLTTEGTIRFIDFEYAGWDDPAKMICDFFCQPAVPVPLQYFTKFIQQLSPGYAQREAFQLRVKLLLPIYNLKWCCILLNHFLPTPASRRQFSGGVVSTETKAKQLCKARDMLSRDLSTLK